MLIGSGGKVIHWYVYHGFFWQQPARTHQLLVQLILNKLESNIEKFTFVYGYLGLPSSH